MDSASFILAINIAVCGFFALAFGLIAAYDANYRSARWFALAYVLGMASVWLELVLPHASGFVVRVVAVAIFAAYLAALLAGVVGFARRFGAPAPWAVIGALFAVSVAVSYFITELPRDSAARLFLYQMPYVAAQALGGYMVLRHGPKRVLEFVLGGFMALSALNYLVKPLIAWQTGGSGTVPGAYLHTQYALYSQTMGSIIALAIGALVIAVYLRDMLADMRLKSETDRLSGLLNRHGFEVRVKSEVVSVGGQRPSCIIICDLDHFKQINDEFGHAAGDRVIEAFSTLLRQLSADNYIIGRIGGEEFAIWLPTATGPVARLFAESVRTSFSGLIVKDLPPLRRFTASFGVAEACPGEDYSSLLRRADVALYEAKRDGRNRVCMAAKPETPEARQQERRQFRSRA